MSVNLALLPALLSSISPQTAPPQAPENIETSVPAEAASPPAADATAATAPVAVPAPEAALEEENVIEVVAQETNPADPVQELNELSYKAVEVVDDAVIVPIIDVYKQTPRPLQKGIHNVISNLDEPIVALNFLLQLKIGKALETVGRFAINSTLGLAGLMDVAKKKPFNLPYRSNGLANTLGFYGVGPGPYFFLPVMGPTTLRDAIARPFDLAILPFAAPKPFGNPLAATSKTVLTSLDDRMRNDEYVKQVRASEENQYILVRDTYLNRRVAEIEVLKGLRTSVDDPTPPVKKKKKAESLNTPANTNG